LIDRYLDVVGTYNGKSRLDVKKEFPTKIKKIDKILVHPFAGWKAKEWNLRKFIDLTIMLSKSFDVELISPGNAISKDILEEVEKDNLKICITKSLNELKNKIKNCSLLVSNDSGPIYIANILGKATFSIYGPTNPNFSLPFGEYHSFIQKNIPCSPVDTQYCFTHAGLYCPSNECMQLLSVEEVYESLLTFINELNQKMNLH
jgi:heptosyltransferase-2